MLGYDKGTTYSKVSNGFIIKSTIKELGEHDVVLDSKNILEYEGKKHIIGEKGEYSTDLMKSQHQNTLLLLLACIGLNSHDDYIEERIVTGLPIGLYSKQKEQMKELFKPNELHRIVINGHKKIIKIKAVEVFPEGAGAFYSQNEKDALVIDIGGLSIDTVEFKGGKMGHYSTYSMGIMKLYSKIANYINSEYDLSLTEWDIEDVLATGLTIYGQRVDLNYHSIIEEYTKEIIARLKLEYDLKAIRNIILAGGGCKVLEPYLKAYIPQCRPINNAQFANVIGYYNIGKVVFK